MISRIILSTLLKINLSTRAGFRSPCAVCTTYLQHNHPLEIPSVHRAWAHEQPLTWNITVACRDSLGLLKLSPQCSEGQFLCLKTLIMLPIVSIGNHWNIFGTQLVSRVVMAIPGDDESWGLDSVWDMIETKLSVSQPAVMAACPQHYTRLTHKCQHIEWGKQCKMVQIVECEMWS